MRLKKKTPPLSSEAYQTRNSDSLTLYNIEHISQFWKENKFIRRHMLHNNISKKIKMTKNGRKLQAHDEVWEEIHEKIIHFEEWNVVENLLKAKR